MRPLDYITTIIVLTLAFSQYTHHMRLRQIDRQYVSTHELTDKILTYNEDIMGYNATIVAHSKLKALKPTP